MSLVLDHGKTGGWVMSGGDFELQDVAVPGPVMIFFRFDWISLGRACEGQQKMTKCPKYATPILNKSMLTSKAILMHFDRIRMFHNEPQLWVKTTGFDRFCLFRGVFRCIDTCIFGFQANFAKHLGVRNPRNPIQYNRWNI